MAVALGCVSRSDRHGKGPDHIGGRMRLDLTTERKPTALCAPASSSSTRTVAGLECASVSRSASQGKSSLFSLTGNRGTPPIQNEANFIFGLARPARTKPHSVSGVPRRCQGVVWRWCSVSAPGSVCRPICSFRLRRSRRPGVRRSERRPDPDRRRAVEGSSHLMSRSRLRASRSNAWTCLRSSIASFVNSPCVIAF